MNLPKFACQHVRPVNVRPGDLVWYYGRLVRVETIAGPVVRWDDVGTLKGSWFTFKFTELNHVVKFMLTGHVRSDCMFLAPDYTDLSQFTGVAL